MRSVLKQTSFISAQKSLVVTSCNVKVTETGWGEFEIQIKIYLADPVERPVTIYHVLKLFQVSKKVNNTPFRLAINKQLAFFLSTECHFSYSYQTYFPCNINTLAIFHSFSSPGKVALSIIMA